MTRASFRAPRTVLGAVGLLLGTAALYGTARLLGNGGAPACAITRAMLPRLLPLARGEVAAFEVSREPRPAPALSFKDASGATVQLAGMAGRTVLLNLWATWCEPCKREMPALDRLDAALGGPAFTVAAVNIDTRDLDRPARWLREAGIVHLAAYADHEARIFQDLRRAGEAEGLPTTILVGPDGCVAGRLSGWAEWASPDGLALIRAAVPARS